MDTQSFSVNITQPDMIVGSWLKEEKNWQSADAAYGQGDHLVHDG
jgi:hypothetical protein